MIVKYLKLVSSKRLVLTNKNKTMGTKIKYGRYMSTYGFVQENELEKVADSVLGKDWEAEDDVTQIQMICDYIKPDKYVVTHISGLKYEEDIEVRAMDSFTSSSVYEWMNLLPHHQFMSG